MIDPYYLDLMNRDIDDDILPSERDALRQYLAGNREASDRYYDLAQVAASLKRVRMLAPPPSLKEAIIANLPEIVTRRSLLAAPAAALVNFWDNLSLRPGLTFAAGTIGGALILILALQFFSARQTSDIFSVSGTMFPSNAVPVHVIDSHTLNAGSATVTCAIGRDSRLIAMRVLLSAPDAVNVILNSSPADMHFLALADSSNLLESYSRTPSEIRLRAAGHGIVTLLLTDISGGASTISVSIDEAGWTSHTVLKTGAINPK